METAIFFLLGFCYFCLLLMEPLRDKTYGLWNYSNFLFLVILGLVYDNWVIAFGKLFGEGKVLETLSAIRYWLHALFTPTLILFIWNVCVKTRLISSKNPFWKVLAYGLTIGLMIYELLTSVRNMKLEPTWKNGVLTYENTVSQGFPIMVIIITIILGIIGFFLLKKFRFPWLLVGTIVMIVGGIMTIWIKNSVFINICELILILSLFLTNRFQKHRSLYI